MEKDREEKNFRVLDVLPQWRAHNGVAASEKNGVYEELQQMCRCIHCDPRPVCREGIYRMLHSWYVPRNANDAAMYEKRCKMWRLFIQYVNELLNCLNRKL